MGIEPQLWAHSANVERGEGLRHSLADHLRSTARLAGAFASVFGAERFVFALGLFHDAGKAGCSWQQRLLAREQAGRGRVGGPHWELGAKLLADVADVGAMAVMGHHGGLTSVDPLRDVLTRVTEDEADAEAGFFAAVPEARSVIAGPELLPPSWTDDPLVLDVGLRMAFSALVDADFLDTAAHFAGNAAPGIPDPVAWAPLAERFETERARLLQKRLTEQGASPIDQERSALYDRVVAQAGLPHGIYRLPAPTGSGKTITAAGFAVHHAAEHHKSRVIMAVPFTTITEQNAEVYRRLLGADVVLEHHSQVDYDHNENDHRARLAAENWDAPVVVTTTVQLFDSLFGRRPARARKLHRLANAVIVLDEVQALPLTLLAPILTALRVLTEHFGVTVLLTSATQPVFQALGAWRNAPVVDLVPRPDAIRLFSRLARVRYEWQVDPKPTLAKVAASIRDQRQALVVVNTIDHAAQMYRLLAERDNPPPVVLHLSTRMVPAHRRDVLAEAGRRLRAGDPVVVVSTQLIEAGVDIDFPVVFRAIAPAESLQQAAGRANREGTRPEGGKVVIFDAVDAAVPRFYRTAVDSTRLFFGPGADAADPDDLEALDGYYRHLYASTGVEKCKRAQTIQRHRVELDFLSVAEGPLWDPQAAARDSHLAFRMIDDDTVPVVVTTYQPRGRKPDPVRDWVGELADPDRRSAAVFRRLRPYLVTLPRRVAADPVMAAMLRPVVGDLLCWEGTYHEQLGVGEGVAGVEMVL
jgi:CRISPR-associated endonuclease/helicase Cas3